MKTFEKIFVGKGKQVKDLEIVKVTCKLEDLAAIAYELDGTRYVTFEIAKMKGADPFGRTHSAYYNKMHVTPEAGEATEKKTRKPAIRKEKKAAAAPIPF